MRRILLGAWIVWATASVCAGSVVHHDLRVSVDPSSGRIAVQDTVTLPGQRKGSPVTFRLHPGMEVTLEGPGRIDAVGPSSGSGEAPGVFRVEPEGRSFTVRYNGVVRHPFSEPREYARGFRTTPGRVDPEGVYLGPDCAWYPQIDGVMVTFTLEVKVPAGWGAVSQGGGGADGAGTWRWACETPQDGIYLVAGPYAVCRRPSNGAEIQVYLRSRDPALADKYLEAGAAYLDMYDGLIGRYPYPKFALVENYWETGWGMPSFTLLGPRIIRFPFILHSSYPHEILHNWWGNSVYVDYGSGNWCEGLTAYLADHLVQEARGRGAGHRQTTLQKYADYVSRSRDFPLSEFRARHSAATEAVGYGKALMVFHMLRRRLGDAVFTAGLRELYRSGRFRTVSWEDVFQAFGRASGRDLSGWLDTWIRRTGAPALELAHVEARRRGRRWKLRVGVQQLQPGGTYDLDVPLAITLEGKRDAVVRKLHLADRRVEWESWFDARPLRVDLDPEFDVFRLLSPAEIPPALSGAFGAPVVTVVLPSEAPPDLARAYREMAEAWAAGQEGEWRIRSDADPFPETGSVWILGWENRWLKRFQEAAASRGLVFSRGGAAWDGQGIRRPDQCGAVAVRRPGRPREVLAWVAADRPAPVEGLARKLPHYHKYSWVVFQGDDPAAVAKGRWPVESSPMTVQLGEEPVERGRLPPREPLARPRPAFSARRMEDTVRTLCAPEMEGRGFGTVGLRRAAEWIARAFERAGLEPAGDGGTWFQRFSARGGEPQAEVELLNVVGVIPGRDRERAAESVVVGAHYDHLGRGWPDARPGERGRIHPGADDNASGVAVLLELARVLARGPAPRRSVVFVAFAAEEAGRLGSRHYVEQPGRYPARRCIAMVNLDTVGRLGEGSLMVLGTGTAAEWIHIANGAGYVTGVRIQPVARDVGGSDQVSFVEAGVPAVQLFTGPHPDYHRPTDTPDKLDFRGLVRVAEVAREFVLYLAERDKPLAAAVGQGERVVGTLRRRATLGVVPDFAFPGPGVRLEGVVSGSPAERAGLAPGDVILTVAGEPLEDLRGLARVLERYGPGGRVVVVYLRDGEKRVAVVRLAPR